jgi:hypothetical protein
MLSTVLYQTTFVECHYYLHSSIEPQTCEQPRFALQKDSWH